MAPISGEKPVLTSILKAAYHQAPILYFIFYPDTPLALFPWATMPFLLFPQNAPVSGPWNWLFPQPGTPPFGQYLLCSFLHFLESLLKCHRGCEAFPDNPIRPSQNPGTLYPPPLFAFSAPDMLFLLTFMYMCTKVTLIACQPSSLPSPWGQGVCVSRIVLRVL